MAIPILKQGDYLVVAIQDELTDAGWHDLRNDLLARAGKYRTRGVLIDVSAMEVMDSFASRMLDGIARMLRFRGDGQVSAQTRARRGTTQCRTTTN